MVQRAISAGSKVLLAATAHGTASERTRFSAIVSDGGFRSRAEEEGAAHVPGRKGSQVEEGAAHVPGKVSVGD